MTRLPFAALAVTCLLCACGGTGDVSRFLEPSMATRDAPPGADPGACWGREVTPALVETVTERHLVSPAAPAAGDRPAREAVYRTETRQHILRERHDLWFETPCPDSLTPAFNAALQRALQVRGHYHGPITAEMDRPTRQAIRAFQREDDLDSDILSIAAAKRLGLVVYDREEALAEAR